MLEWNAEGKRRKWKVKTAVMYKVRRTVVNRRFAEVERRVENYGEAEFHWIEEQQKQ